MKKYFLLVIFCISAVATAQYNPYNPHGGGVDRSLTNQHQGTKSNKKEEKIDMVERSMKKLDEELKLDSFQSAVIRQLLKDNEAEQNKIVEEDIPNESKMEKITALRIKTNEKIKEILRPDQIVLFDNLGKKKGKK